MKLKLLSMTLIFMLMTSSITMAFEIEDQIPIQPEIEAELPEQEFSAEDTISSGQMQISAIAGQTDAEIVALDKGALTQEKLFTAPLPTSGYLIDALHLPLTGVNGSAIGWSSSDESIISTTGKVMRPVFADETVTLTAHIQFGAESDQKEFHFLVAAMTTEVEGMPKLSSLRLYDDFEDGVEKSTYAMGRNGGSVEEKDGKLHVIRSANTGVTSATLYPYEAREDLTGKFVMEYTLTRNKAGRILTRFNNASGRNFLSLDWNASTNGALNAIYSPVEGQDGSGVTINGHNQTVKVTLFVDTETGVFSLWINNSLRIKDAYARHSGTLSFTAPRIYMETTTFVEVTIDEYKIYQVREDMDENERLNLDYDALKYQDLLTAPEILDGIVANNLDLPKYGKNGSQITWKSSDPSILSHEGILAQSGVLGANSVTLTATIESGAGSRTKAFTIRVLPDDSKAQLDYEALIYESLLSKPEVLEGMIADDLILPARGKYGSIIEWTSSDENVITPEGKVIRMAGVNAAVTMTAKVMVGTIQMIKTFDFQVLNAEVDANGLPVVKEMIAENDFEDQDHTNTIHMGLAAGGTVEIKDGKLRLTRSDPDSSVTEVRLYARLNTNNYAVEGLIGVEYVLTRAAASNIVVHMRGASDANYVTWTWRANGDVAAAFCDSPTEESYSRVVANSNGNTMKVNGLFDTKNSTFMLWINGEKVVKNGYSRAAGVSTYHYLRVYMEGANRTTVTVDDHKVYYAHPPSVDALDFDLGDLTGLSLLTGSYVADNIIDSDLVLPNRLKYGSQVVWQSSDPSLIDPLTGKVTRPVNGIENPEVILTALVSNSGFSKTVEFRYRVQKLITDPGLVAYADMQDFAYSFITHEDPNAIRMSLNFLSKGIHGSNIVWESSNTDVITNGGRVIRPRVDKSHETVTVTAHFNGTYSKDFTFTVLADDPISDDQTISDASFFGKWSDGRWTTEPKLDYSLSGLKEVEKAVKDNDYPLAKTKLLAYMQTRNAPAIKGLDGRSPGWINMLVDNLHDLQGSAYYRADMTVDSEEFMPFYSTGILASTIPSNAKLSLSVIARYNEMSEVTIAGSKYPVQNMRPKLEVTVNGATRLYYAESSATLRTGNYKKEHVGGNETTKVKMFGEFLGDETYRTILRFDFTDIKETDKISGVRLILNAKKTPSYAEPKQLIVLKDSNNLWDEKTVTWSDLTTYVHNFNGIPGGNYWGEVIGADIEYRVQSQRFLGFKSMATEYKYTNDEKYSYFMIQSMLDYIDDRGYGVTPRTLDASIRLANWSVIMDTLVHSRYMTAEACTMILKAIQNTCYSLLSTSSGANWRITEFMNVFICAKVFPEFTSSQLCVERSHEEYLAMMKDYILPDGSYIEDTGGYHTGSYANFMNYKDMAAQAGVAVPEEYDQRLWEGAYYNLLFRGPAGENLGYGDNGNNGGTAEQKYPKVFNWYNDYELLYIDTFGQKGNEPSWTSRHFPDSTFTMMRANWSKTTPYLFTSVRGDTDGHSHPDDNAIIMFAYGRRLLADGGIFSYTWTDPYTILGHATRNHNTVEINGKNQGETPGVVHDFVTNQNYDYLSQSALAYEGFDHRRTITFIKPFFWIVSDHITPEDLEGENTYRQSWHMPPTANALIDKGAHTIGSTYSGGGNVIIGNADGDAQLIEDIGYYDYSYGAVVETPYGYYGKSDVKGVTSFDTVIYPYNGTRASLKTERIPLDVPKEEATAMKFTTTGTANLTTYYLLDYAHNMQNPRTFDKFTTNAELTVINEDRYGNMAEVVLKNGSRVTNKNGTTLLGSTVVLENLSATVAGTTLEILGDEDLDPTKLMVTVSQEIKGVSVNGTFKHFNQDENGVISIYEEDTAARPENDNNQQKGIKDGGTNSPGGTNPPGGTDIPGGNTGNVGNGIFKDIEGHWAKDYIESMYEIGVVNGDEQGNFHPNNSVTRAELISMVVRSMGLKTEPYNQEFGDIQASDWYAGAVAAALTAGLIAHDEVFRPNDAVTREEMSKILSGCILLIKKDLEELPEDFTLTYVDKGQISDWAEEYVKFTGYHGYMQGSDTGEFMPKGKTTRAEAATVLARMLLE